jgi:hypothetical protein
MSQMIEVKTAELIGPALDLAVGKALGAEVKGHAFSDAPGSYVFPNCTVFPDGSAHSRWRPSTDWIQGGPLIDRYLIDFCVEHASVICSVLCDENGMHIGEYSYGETHLIAACRAIVAAKLGDTVQVPAELVTP